MKVCLIDPSDFFAHSPLPYRFNQSLFYLYSYLRRHAPHIEVEILDLSLELGFPRTTSELIIFLKETEILLERSGFDVAGISCWSTYNYPSSVEMARLCRKLNPQSVVIVGGWHPTFIPEDFCSPDSPFDYVVRGEGEKALLDILTGQVPKERTPQVVEGIPLPMDHDLHWGECKYHRVLDLMPLWLSRGCPCARAYCVDHLADCRFLSPQVAMDEVKRLVAANPHVNSVLFHDPVFGVRRDWRREFFSLLRKADLPVHYWAETRPDLVGKEDVEVVADLNFRVDLDLGSVVPEMLTIMKMTGDPERYLEHCFELDTALIQKRIPHLFRCTYNHPGETSRTLQELQNFWGKYYRQAPGLLPVFVSADPFEFLPGVGVFADRQVYEVEYGTAFGNREWWKMTAFPPEYHSTDVIASRELAKPESLNLPARVALRLAELARQHVDHVAFQPYKIQPPPSWEGEGLLARQGSQYFDDKPLRLHPRTSLHKCMDGTVILHSFTAGRSVPLNRLGTNRLEAVLAGSQIREVGGTLDHYPNAETQWAKLRNFFSDLLAGEFLMLGYLPPTAAPTVDGRPRVRLQTSCGTIELELYLDRAPQLVANFLYLVTNRFYDGLRITTEHPGTWLEIGLITRSGGGPGYTLAPDETGLPLVRGALSMVQQDIRLHGSRIRLYRHQMAGDRSFVFGQVVGGWGTLDALLPGDSVITVQMVAELGTGAGGMQPVTTEV